MHVGARLTWVQSLAQEVPSHQPLASLLSGSVSLSTDREFELFLPRRLVGGPKRANKEKPLTHSRHWGSSGPGCS